MSDLDKSSEATEAAGQKVDTLAVSVDARFDAVDAALNQQRQYTEFAFDRLRDEMKNGFDAINGRLDGVDGRVNSIDRRVNSMDSRFDRVDGRLDGVDSRLDSINTRFDSVDSRFDRVDSRFDRLERKLDQFIDTQTTANTLVERRLAALEPPSAHE